MTATSPLVRPVPASSMEQRQQSCSRRKVNQTSGRTQSEKFVDKRGWCSDVPNRAVCLAHLKIVRMTHPAPTLPATLLTTNPATSSRTRPCSGKFDNQLLAGKRAGELSC